MQAVQYEGEGERPMIKRDELADPNSCLNKAADDEPIFVLRAQDFLAPAAVTRWLHLAYVNGAMLGTARRAEAQAVVAAMESWPTRKLPD